MPGVFWFLIYYVFLVRVMVNTENVNALSVALRVKGKVKTYIVLAEQTPDLVSNAMDRIRAQEMEF